MKKKDILTALFTLLLLVAAGYLWLAPSGLQRVPDLTLEIIDGRKLNLTQLKGRPVLVTFWATSCPGCIKEMPHLIDLYKALNPRGLEIIGIAMPYDRPDHVLEMVRQKQLPYPIALDLQGTAMHAFDEVKLTPTSFLIDPQGRIVMHKIGEMDMAKLQQQIENYLQHNTQG